MADVNQFILQGKIPGFENAVRSGNLENKERAYCRFKLSVTTSQKDDNGYYKNEIYDLVAFGASAVMMANYAKPGTGFVVTGVLKPGSVIQDNGTDLLDVNGRKVYSGVELIARNISFQSTNEKGSASGNSVSKTATNTAKKPAGNNIIIDPLNMMETNGFPM